MNGLCTVDFHTHYDWQSPVCCPENVCRIISTPLAEADRPLPGNVLQTLELHPWDGNSWSQEFEHTALNGKFSGIGEVGLDRLRGKLPLNEQLLILRKACEFAAVHQKTLTIHCVKCFSELLELYKQIRWQTPTIIHYFRSNLPLARQLWEHTHFTLSLPPAALTQQELWDFLRDHREYQSRIVLETDDPHHGDIEAHYRQSAAQLEITFEQLQKLMQMQLRSLYNV